MIDPNDGQHGAWRQLKKWNAALGRWYTLLRTDPSPANQVAIHQGLETAKQEYAKAYARWIAEAMPEEVE